MNCLEIENGDLAERYILGQLRSDEQQSYEEHYFQCSRCFDDLQLKQTMQAELSRMHPNAAASPTGRGRINWLVWGAIAATVAVAVGVGWWRFHASPEPPAQSASNAPKPADHTAELELLARADPPAYAAPTLRGPSTVSARYREGMAQYRVGNYEAAIATLSEAATADPKSADTQFFLGICYLLTGRTQQAIERLRATIALGDSLDLEMAHYYLAKALLRDKDVTRAEAELERAIAMHGDLEKQSRDLLDQIRKLTAAR